MQVNQIHDGSEGMIASEPGKVFIKTFGCQMNVYDTEKIYAFLQNSFVPTSHEEDADLILVNTCSIRDKAEQKVYSLLGRLKPLKAANPDLLVGVGGCVAQQEGEKLLARAPMIDLVFGTHNIDQLPDLINERISTGKRICRVIDDTDSVPTANAPGKNTGFSPTSFLTIMKGCDNYCAYCVVPLVRGREVSRSSSDIINEALSLVENGVREITLLGQNVNSYCDPDDGTGFVDLLKQIDDIKDLLRLRFVTSHPKDFSLELARGMSELPTVCNHIHLPIQAGSDRILKSMKRGYTVKDYMEKVEILRKYVPEVELTSDIIVGFPGETRADFESTLSVLREIRYQNVFSFRYSPRPGTAAEKMKDNISDVERKPWLPELQDIQSRITSEKHEAMTGKTLDVLVEGTGRKGNGILKGRTLNNFIVHFSGSVNLVGSVVKVSTKRSRTIHLEGELVP